MDDEQQRLLAAVAGPAPIDPTAYNVAMRPPLQIDATAQQFVQGGASPTKAFSDVRPPKENINTVLDSNFNYGRSVGNENAPVNSLNSGVSASITDANKVKALVNQMNSPDGYWERPIVDDAGNVIEGQHRVEAAKQIGVNQVPVYRVQDMERGLPTDQMVQAIKDTQKTHPDHVHQIMGQVLGMIHETGSPAAALNQYEFPAQFKDRFEAALKAAQQ